MANVNSHAKPARTPDRRSDAHASRTSLEEILKAGRAIIETDGIDGLTMQAIADRVGVRAPSCKSDQEPEPAPPPLVAMMLRLN
jgi:hypothetical protein